MVKGSSATSQRSVQRAKDSLSRFLKKVKTVPTAILEQEAQKLYADIVAETPVRTGKLVRSVKVSVSKNKRKPGLNASASAIAPNGYNYAGIQHEVRTFNHLEGKDHYISDPFKRCTRRIKYKLRKELTLK